MLHPRPHKIHTPRRNATAILVTAPAAIAQQDSHHSRTHIKVRNSSSYRTGSNPRSRGIRCSDIGKYCDRVV